MEDVDMTEYARRERYNDCLDGVMAIALDGSILPCPSWPEPINNICAGKGIGPVLRPLVADTIFKYWEASKAEIPGCRNCENRYACTDCAVLEWETHRDVTERCRYCDYVPELGTWQEGTN